MVTNGKVASDFWQSASLEDRPVSGWQKLRVDSVRDVQTSDDFDWLGDQKQIQINCIVTEGEHTGAFTTATFRVGGSSGVTKDGRAFTIKEEDTLNTTRDRIARILDLRISKIDLGAIVAEPSDLLTSAKLQAVVEMTEGAVFFGDVRVDRNGWPRVGDGKTHVRSLSDPPDIYADAVQDGFKA